MVELLSPVGDFECLKAAVQNGADSVYLGGSLFNARASATNFDNELLKKAIRYAKLRNVKINFALNTLIKNEEFDEAINLANYVYKLGADAIIVQDMGLAKYIINNLPDMDVHASTQMTIHNLQGVQALEKLGFKRVVLSRELSLSEIRYICSNCNVEIEAFVHGALCISYSGQCLFSSTIGARSGNRGRCAQPCRLPYTLLDENSKKLDSGYLLSPRDLCSLKYIPDLIDAGVSCFKIEGRMKTPDYVATVTRIYRKYIDLALSDKEYIIDNEDIKSLMQVFNRGGFSSGNFEDEENLDYVYKEKPNNMGLYIGNVSSINKNKGLITLTSSEPLQIGDQISLEKEAHKYTISELMNKNNNNISISQNNEIVTIGRMKGNISLGDKIYKLSNKILSKNIKEFYDNENIKIPLYCHITIKKGHPISLEVSPLDSHKIYKNIKILKDSDIFPTDATNQPITEERIIKQLSKTTNTYFEFKKIDVDLDENTFLPKISAINQLRRDCLEELEKIAIQNFERTLPNSKKKQISLQSLDNSFVSHSNNFVSHSNNFVTPKINLLLNELNPEFDYSSLHDVDKVYLPLKCFIKKDYADIISMLSFKFNVYIYMPTIIKDNYRNVIYNSLDNFIYKFNIRGIVVSNVSSIVSLKKYLGKVDLVGNYTLNIFNCHSIQAFKTAGLSSITLSPELDKQTLCNMAKTSPLPTELMVYGNLPIMNMGYCLLGKSNKCYPTCSTLCMENNKYYIQDRLGYKFRVIPDNLQTVTTIYNSKITSISYSDIKPSSVRISILDESISDINNIIDNVKSDIPLAGDLYTNGNLNKIV